MAATSPNLSQVEITVERTSQPTSVSVVQQIETESTFEPEEELVLVQTTNQFDTYRRVVVSPAQETQIELQPLIVSESETKIVEKRSPKISTASEEEKGENEYQKLNTVTLRRYYGDATPYGTVARVHKTQSEEDVLVDVAPSATFPRSASRVKKEAGQPDNSFAVESFGQTCTLRRGKHGFYTTVSMPKGKADNLRYADFLPLKKKGKQGLVATMSKRYEKFQDCVDRANLFLEQNPKLQIQGCETLIQRLDHDHRINSESTTSNDRSHVKGLRLWYTMRGKEKPITESTEDGEEQESQAQADTAPASPTTIAAKLCYMNVIPDYKNKKYAEGVKRKVDHPEFETMRATVKKFNRIQAETPIQGRLLNVEAIPINYSIALNEEGDLDPDVGYWCLDAQGHWDLVILRVFYIESPTTSIHELDLKDFSAAPTKVSGHQPEFEDMKSLNARASEWLCSGASKSVLSLWPQLIEQPFKLRDLVSSKGKLDTDVSCYVPTKNSAHWNTLRVLRLWFTRPRPLISSTLPARESRTGIGFGRGIAVYTILPCQATLAGCCGVRKPIFATTEDTVTRLNAWISNTGADVIAVHTDSVEKWRGKKCEPGRLLGDRVYNRQDFSSSKTSSSLDYRLTVLRVFVRSDEKGNLPREKKDDLPKCPEPVDPCCCFVGCTIM